MTNQELLRLKADIDSLTWSLYEARTVARDLIEQCSCTPETGIPPQYGHCGWCRAVKIVEGWEKPDDRYETSPHQ
jgi:hypothetical protein